MHHLAVSLAPFVLALTLGAQTQHSLTTGFPSGTPAYGIQFDVVATHDLTIERFDVSAFPVPSVVRVDIYFRPGSYAGFEQSPAGWGPPLFSQVLPVSSAGGNSLQPLTTPVTLSAGQRRGFYVHIESLSLPIPPQFVTPAVPAVVVQDANLQILTGTAFSLSPTPFTSPGQRANWHGTIHYSTPAMDCAPSVWVGGSPRIGGTFQVCALAERGCNVAVLGSLVPGPFPILGFNLQVSPPFAVLASGSIAPAGQPACASFAVPFAQELIGLDVFYHGLGILPEQPATLRAGDFGVIEIRADRLVDAFVHPLLDPFTGDYDASVIGRLQGAFGRRTVWPHDPTFTPFGQPLLTPLAPFGSIAQLVYRKLDLVGTDREELLTALRWKPFGPVTADSFADFQIVLAHSLVVPDYSLDPISLLPSNPNSGLNTIFGTNYKPGEKPVRVASGPYLINPTALRGDGYLDYPLDATFAYNGVDSLLVEFRTAPSAAIGLNGHSVLLPLQSDFHPFARVFRTGNATTPVDPTLAPAGQGDNTIYDLQFELTRVKSTGTSPWRATFAGVDYGTPLLTVIEPPGTSLVVEYRGADDAGGANATTWSADIDGADGKPFLQYRARFTANVATGAVPALDHLEIPLQ